MGTKINWLTLSIIVVYIFVKIWISRITYFAGFDLI